MKKYLWIIGTLLFASCIASNMSDLGEETFNVPKQTRFTYVEFQNQGSYDVTVYSNATRQTAISDVSAGKTVQKEWLPNMDGYSFYMTYHLPIIGGYRMPYIPPPPSIDFVEVVIPRYQTTPVRIQDLGQIVTDGNKPLSNNDIYLGIRNNGASAFRLYRSTSEQSPVNGNGQSNAINVGGTGVYRITQTSGSEYAIWVGSQQRPIGLTFEAGNCYSLDFDGSAVSLTKTTQITLNNIRVGSW